MHCWDASKVLKSELLSCSTAFQTALWFFCNHWWVDGTDEGLKEQNWTKKKKIKIVFPLERHHHLVKFFLAFHPWCSELPGKGAVSLRANPITDAGLGGPRGINQPNCTSVALQGKTAFTIWFCEVFPLKNLGKSEGEKKKRLITQSRATVTSYVRYNKCQKNFGSKLLIFLLVWNLQRSFLLSMCLVKSFSSEFASGSIYSFIFKCFVPCWFYLKITWLACAIWFYVCI